MNETMRMVKDWMINNLDGDCIADYGDVALRYDDVLLSVGDYLDNSMTNDDRDDGRDYPEFDNRDKDTEYLDGTSAYRVCGYDDLTDCEGPNDVETLLNNVEYKDHVFTDKELSHWSHCTIVSGQPNTDEAWEDNGEVVLTDCKVLAVLW